MTRLASHLDTRSDGYRRNHAEMTRRVAELRALTQRVRHERPQRDLFNQYGPCLILVDEWVAYARQLHDQSDLPAGGFETQFSFAQALTAAAQAAPGSGSSGTPGSGS